MMWRLLVILSLYSGYALGQQCYEDWHYFNGACYGIGEEVLSWGDAQEMCETFGAKLAEIESTEENEYLKNMARTEHADHYWLGGTDIFHEGSWQWVSTRQAIYPFTDWGPGQPDDSGSHEDCLDLYRALDYRWNDAPCDMELNFICETSPLETVVG